MVPVRLMTHPCTSCRLMYLINPADWQLNSAVQSAHEAAKKLADQYMETENSIMDAADDAQKLALYPAYAKVIMVNH